MYTEMIKKYKLKLNEYEERKNNRYIQLEDIKQKCENIKNEIKTIEKYNKLLETKLETEVNEVETEVKITKKEILELLVKLLTGISFILIILSSCMGGQIIAVAAEIILTSGILFSGIYLVSSNVIVPKIYKEFSEKNRILLHENEEKLKEKTNELNICTTNFNKIKDQYNEENEKYQSQKGMVDSILEDLNELINCLNEVTDPQIIEEKQKIFQKKYGSLI